MLKKLGRGFNHARKIALPLPVVLLIAFFVGTVGVLAGTNLDSPSAPGSTNSYTLEDIYQRLDAGTTASQSTFTEPAVAPGTGTMHDLKDIYNAIPAEGSDVDGADGSKTFNIPDGIYRSDTATCNDSQLTAGNIKSGVDILGVMGTYAGTTCTGDATATDVLASKTFSNNNSTGLTGKRYGGCHCECTGCTLNGTRWCDNGDGTVTDLLGNNGEGQCLVWLKDASCSGTMKWEVHVAQSGLLDNGQCGLSDGSIQTDWWLASPGNLRDINQGTESVNPTQMRAFTGVQDTYWTSMIFFFECRYLFSTDAMDCNDPGANEFYGWSIRLWKEP